MAMSFGAAMNHTHAKHLRAELTRVGLPPVVNTSLGWPGHGADFECNFTTVSLGQGAAVRRCGGAAVQWCGGAVVVSFILHPTTPHRTPHHTAPRTAHRAPRRASLHLISPHRHQYDSVPPDVGTGSSSMVHNGSTSSGLCPFSGRAHTAELPAGHPELPGAATAAIAAAAASSSKAPVALKEEMAGHSAVHKLTGSGDYEHCYVLNREAGIVLEWSLTWPSREGNLSVKISADDPSNGTAGAWVGIGWRPSSMAGGQALLDVGTGKTFEMGMGGADIVLGEVDASASVGAGASGEARARAVRYRRCTRRSTPARPRPATTLPSPTRRLSSSRPMAAGPMAAGPAAWRSHSRGPLRVRAASTAISGP